METLKKGGGVCGVGVISLVFMAELAFGNESGFSSAESVASDLARLSVILLDCRSEED